LSVSEPTRQQLLESLAIHDFPHLPDMPELAQGPAPKPFDPPRTRANDIVGPFGSGQPQRVFPKIDPPRLELKRRLANVFKALDLHGQRHHPMQSAHRERGRQHHAAHGVAL
jgi:hypothetical protein